MSVWNYSYRQYLFEWLTDPSLYIDTTGLQSSTAVVELNGSITVTCTFATGASSTGCQVTIFTMDNFQEVFSTNISRHNGASQVWKSLLNLIAYRWDSIALRWLFLGVLIFELEIHVYVHKYCNHGPYTIDFAWVHVPWVHLYLIHAPVHPSYAQHL